jgi:periplasmic copper chaperone A
MSLHSRFAVLILVAAATLGTAQAHDYNLGPLQIAHPWARATPKGAAVAGGYLKVTNKGSEPDRLIGGSTPIAGRFQIHEMTMDNDVMKMREKEGGIVIPPGQTVELAPGGLHVMMLDLKQPLTAGEKVKGTLRFEKAGTVEVEFAVEAMGGPSDKPHGH